MKSSIINVFVGPLRCDEFVKGLIQAGYKEGGSLTSESTFDRTAAKIFEISINNKLFSMRSINAGSLKFDMNSYDFADLFL